MENLSGNWERNRRKRSQSWSVSQGGIYIYNPPPQSPRNSRADCANSSTLCLFRLGLCSVCFGTIFFHILRLRNTAYYCSQGPTYPKRRQSFMKRLKDRQPTFLTTRARVKCQVSRSKWQCALQYCERWKPYLYVRFGMSRGYASPGMITYGWRGYNPCSRNPFMVKPNRQLFPRREDRGQETTSLYYTMCI